MLRKSVPFGLAALLAALLFLLARSGRDDPPDRARATRGGVIGRGPASASATAGSKELDALIAAGRAEDARRTLAELAAEAPKFPNWEKMRLVQRQAEQAARDGRQEEAVRIIKAAQLRSPENRRPLFDVGMDLLAPLAISGRSDLASDLAVHLLATNPDLVTTGHLSNAWVLTRWGGPPELADRLRAQLIRDYPDSVTAKEVQLMFAGSFEQHPAERLPEVHEALAFVEQSGAADADDLERVASLRKLMRTLAKIGLLPSAGGGELKPTPDPAFAAPAERPES